MTRNKFRAYSKSSLEHTISNCPRSLSRAY